MTELLRIFNQKIVWLILILNIFGFAILSYRILEVPPGINGDEAVIGYNAALIAKNGYDERGKFLPVFTTSQDSLDWKQPVTVYATVLAFKIFGPSFFVLRIVSVFLVILSANLIFLLVREITGRIVVAFFGMTLFLIMPSVVIQSHLALENIAPIPFITLWLLFLIKFYKSGRQLYLVMSALSLGISFYSYLGLRLIVPILTILSSIFIWLIKDVKAKRIKIINSFKFIIILLPFFGLLFFLRGQYPAAVVAQFKFSNLPSYQDFFLSYLSLFDFSFLYVTGDTTPYHSTGRQGVVLLTSLPLFILGVILIIRKKSLILLLVLLSFVLSPILYGLTPSIHRGSRILVLLPFYIVICSLGFLALLTIKRFLIKLTFICMAIFLLFINYLDLLKDYWFDYPLRVKKEFAQPLHLPFQRLYQSAQDNKLHPFIQGGLEGQNKLAFKFFEQIYFPEGLDRWTPPDVPEKSIIFVDAHDPPIKDKEDLKMIQVNGGNFLLLIND